MKLICFLEEGRSSLPIQPAPVTRDWMNETQKRFAYRCLPLSIANAHGWEICCQESFEAIWNGESGLDAIRVTPPENRTALSHFGSGVLTFHVPGVFRTEPGWNLMVMGSPNRPKRGIHPLTAMIETDWSPYGFTMNWKFTEPNYPIRFEKGEPFCFFFPIPRGTVDQTEPEFRKMRSDPDLYEQNRQWAEERKHFIEDLSDPESEAAKKKWQRSYYTGLRPDGEKGIPDHQLKVQAKPFAPL